MTAGKKLLAELSQHLSTVRGALTPDFAVGKATWFRTGGSADILFEPADYDDLVTFLRNVPKDIPLKLLGMGSNMLVRDGGFRGIFIRLAPKIFGEIKLLSSNKLQVGAGAPDKWVSTFALKNSLGGFHFYHGIPGAIGGALRMNAGANGCQTSDLLLGATALDRDGNLHELSVSDMGYSYRECAVDNSLIFIDAIFRAESEDNIKIQRDIDSVQNHRNEVQPVKEKTGGSTFKNVTGHSAWQLIDEVGGRGYICGGAQMSELHCNFMINANNASAYDLEKLGEIMRGKVLAEKNIKLSWEIDRVGEYEENKILTAFMQAC